METGNGCAQRRRNLPDPSFHESRWGEGSRTSPDRELCLVPPLPVLTHHGEKYMSTLNQQLTPCTPSDLLPSVIPHPLPFPARTQPWPLSLWTLTLVLPFPTTSQVQSSHFDFMHLRNSYQPQIPSTKQWKVFQHRQTALASSLKTFPKLAQLPGFAHRKSLSHLWYFPSVIPKVFLKPAKTV